MLIDHGSRFQTANAQTEAIGELLCQQESIPVVTAHMELASPDISDGLAALAAAGAKQIGVIPLFIADGKHLQRDIPALLQKAAGMHAIEYQLLGPLATDARFLEYLSSRMQQDAGRSG